MDLFMSERFSPDPLSVVQFRDLEWRMQNPEFTSISQRLNPESSLLQTPIEGSSSGCQNLRPWQDSREHFEQDTADYVTFTRPLSAVSPAWDRNFLNILGKYCIKSAIKDCQNPECLEKRNRLDKVLPRKCGGWNSFRQWVLVTMSCFLYQNEKGEHNYHLKHILHMPWRLLACKRHNDEMLHGKLFDQGKEHKVDLFQVCNIICWLCNATFQRGAAPGDADFLPLRFCISEVTQALSRARALDLCQARVWRVIKASPRQTIDLPDLIDMLRHISLEPKGKHRYCTEDFCPSENVNSTFVKQMHKCEEEVCSETFFPPSELEHAVTHNLPTAWRITPARTVDCFRNDYMAISHVWADGTGIGLKMPGTVNSCLVDYFLDIAERLQCNGIWWDTVCLPTEGRARKKAIDNMHYNYEQAKWMVVHDKGLVEFEWKDDGSPCVALLLSAWFTRGWTALELYMSENVMVLFKDPNGKENGDRPLLKNLDTEVLAQDFALAHPAYRLATLAIGKLRRGGRAHGLEFQGLLSMLHARVTSWARDRIIIAGLLADLPNFDSSKSESQITRQILVNCTFIPVDSLFHGRVTICESGPWSWCPQSLYDMGHIQASRKMTAPLTVHHNGSLTGSWHYSTLAEDDTKDMQFFGQQLFIQTRITNAMQNLKNCLLLRSLPDTDLCLLVTTVGCGIDNTNDPFIECRYIGPIIWPVDGAKKGLSESVNIRIGADQGQREIDAQEVVKIYRRNREIQVNNQAVDLDRRRWAPDSVVPKIYSEYEIKSARRRRQRVYRPCYQRGRHRSEEIFWGKDDDGEPYSNTEPVPAKYLLAIEYRYGKPPIYYDEKV